MNPLPIRKVNLFRHGVGYFERGGEIEGTEVTLAVRAVDMPDTLKSLTVIDHGDGHVLGIDYATPRARDERLATVRIKPKRHETLRTVLEQFAGRRARLNLGDGTSHTGQVIGLDGPVANSPAGDWTVSLLADGTDTLLPVRLGSVVAVDLLDPALTNDLRHFLASTDDEAVRSLRVRLSDGRHDLTVAYVAAAPAWRVSYRLVLAAPDETDADAAALLQGWGIFDNLLDEDLVDVAVTLTAGQPVSFVYDLYSPVTPARPQLGDDPKRMQAPVEFEGALGASSLDDFDELEEPVHAARVADAGTSYDALAKSASARRAAVARTAPAVAAGRERDELFSYVIATPVSVGRGQSAMVPIANGSVPGRRRLIYNAVHNPAHPIATVALRNDTGLTLERGPVTLFDAAGYLGEAMLPFLPAGASADVAYAVEMGVHVGETSEQSMAVHGLSLEQGCVRVETWRIATATYQLDNRTARAVTVLVEVPLIKGHDLASPPVPVERGATHARYAVPMAAGTVATLRVAQRRLVREEQTLARLDAGKLAEYIGSDLLDPATRARLAPLLDLAAQRERVRLNLDAVDTESHRIVLRQKALTESKLPALGREGPEGLLRNRYVQELGASETRLDEVEQQRRELQAEMDRLGQAIDALVAGG